MEGEDEDSEDERAFNNKPAWQRACVLAAGPFMNLLTAMLLLVVIATWAGQPTTTVSQVLDDSPAYEAGSRRETRYSRWTEQRSRNGTIF